MKIAARFTLIMSMFSWLFGSQKAESSSPVKSDWAIAEVRYSDGTLGIIRYAQAKPKGWQSVPLSEEVSLTWKYDGQLPDVETDMRMREMERALDTPDPDSALALVITAKGEKEWIFYARDYDMFMERLNEKLSDKPHFPISIVHSHDPKWAYWESFMSLISKK